MKLTLFHKALIVRPVAIGMNGGTAPRWGAALLMASIVARAGSPLSAQQTIGRAMGPSVSVDYGVLDALGPAPTLPSLLLGRMPRPLAAEPAGIPAGIPGADRPRFPVLSGPNASLPKDRVVLIRPGTKPSVRKTAKPKRRADLIGIVEQQCLDGGRTEVDP